jgi:RimJ/RimL family protein N-acetyltransferase
MCGCLHRRESPVVSIEDSGATPAEGRVAATITPMSNARWVQPVTLEGTIVRLEPLSLEHLADLADVAFDGDLWRWTMVQPTNRDELRAWLEAAVAAKEAGTEMPFATIDRASGRAVGSSRFMSIVPEHRRLEIGWTWVDLAHQRTGANREAKLLQMTHAFETLAANRVEFKTDSLNEKANPGLLGIGATFEGTFRNHMVMPGGRLRHSNYYAVVREDWPRVKAELESRIRAR